MMQIMKDIINSSGIIWKIDRGGKGIMEDYFYAREKLEVEVEKRQLTKQMLVYKNYVLIRIVINMIVYSGWHRKYVIVGE